LGWRESDATCTGRPAAGVARLMALGLGAGLTDAFGVDFGFGVGFAGEAVGRGVTLARADGAGEGFAVAAGLGAAAIRTGSWRTELRPGAGFGA
jgi:hypothetical protein